MIQIPYSKIIDNNPNLESLSNEITEIGNEAITNAIKENQEANIPTVFSFDLGLVYMLPDGKLVKNSPFELVENEI